MAAPNAAPASRPLVDAVTVLSLLTTVLILALAYGLSRRLLPGSARPRTRALFTWHAFDALVHVLLEGSFLYNCFFVASAPLSPADLLAATVGQLQHAGAGAAAAAPQPGHALVTAPGVHFLADPAALYGPAYGTGPTSRLWQEYARADRRWAGADLTVVSLELLTVLLGGPLAAWVCYLLVREGEVQTAGKGGGSRLGGRLAFWMAVLATGELYGGFMTFAPEWLSGNPNLDTSNFMYLWVYLVFFNMLWVFLPLWSLREAYVSITSASAESGAAKKTK